MTHPYILVKISQSRSHDIRKEVVTNRMAGKLAARQKGILSRLTTFWKQTQEAEAALSALTTQEIRKLSVR